MVDLYSPRTEGESALLKSVMDYSGIPYYVRNDFFASLRVGPHIDLLNVKTFMVPKEHQRQAQEFILDYLSATVPDPFPLLLRDRLRVVLEFLLFGWFIPGKMPGRKYREILEARSATPST